MSSHNELFYYANWRKLDGGYYMVHHDRAYKIADFSLLESNTNDKFKVALTIKDIFTANIKNIILTFSETTEIQIPIVDIKYYLVIDIIADGVFKVLDQKTDSFYTMTFNDSLCKYVKKAFEADKSVEITVTTAMNETHLTKCTSILSI